MEDGEEMDESCPTIEGLDELRGESDAKREWPQPMNEGASREMALRLVEGFDAEGWIKEDGKVETPRADFYTSKHLLNSRVFKEEGDIQTLSHGYQQLSMSYTLVWVRFTDSDMELVVRGCKFFDSAPGTPRYLCPPPFDRAKVRQAATAENYADALTALAYVDEVRRMEASSRAKQQLFVGKHALHHLYFAATMYCALYFCHFVLEAKQKTSRSSSSICISIAPGKPDPVEKQSTTNNGVIHPSRMKNFTTQ